MKKLLLVTIAATMVLNSCNNKPISPDNKRVDIELTQAQKQMISSNNDFAFNLFRAMQSEGSQIVSPLSVTFALSMLNNGATGETHQQINNVLGFGEQQTAEVNELCKKLITEAPNLDKLTKSIIANTIFVNQPHQLKPAFVSTANEFYNAAPQSRNFNDGQTLDVINKWASDNTEKMITEILNEEEFCPDAVSYLLNAIYFKGAWSQKFKKSETRNESFNGSGDVPMMHQTNDFLYTHNENCQILGMPYGNGAYNMTVLLPYEGKTTDDILNTLNGQMWSAINRQMVTYQVDVKLPRFETQSDIDLKGKMASLGMPKAFTEEAEFGEFCETSTLIS